MPLYEIIRDELITDIERGKIPAGALLPSIRDMSVRWTVSTTTARRVLSEMVNAGYAHPEGTRGHTAIRPGTGEATRAPAGRTDASVHSGSHSDVRKGVAPVLRTAQVVAAKGVVDASPTNVDVRSEPAPPEAVMALQLPDHTMPVVVRRRVTMDSEGGPIQYRVSYLAPNVSSENPPLASTDVIDEPWLDALTTHTGRTIKVSESYICARHPTDTEAAMLALPLGACVLVRVDRAVDEDGQPADYTITVWPGDTTRIQN
ncbi:GntR family transcriptional regulator [Nonomuraea sp. PA05]|uniref:GntR family transcriptional regulator n=1 Tax=Nonomuraea sp. PA05 TaxID=2604466 RepID=UPI0011D9D5AF|nr:GntR family transcriptional regulator [Nonomuraea sp. PA05]